MGNEQETKRGPGRPQVFASRRYLALSPEMNEALKTWALSAGMPINAAVRVAVKRLLKTDPKAKRRD